jgi:hypothetical protein
MNTTGVRVAVQLPPPKPPLPTPGLKPPASCVAAPWQMKPLLLPQSSAWAVEGISAASVPDTGSRADKTSPEAQVEMEAELERRQETNVSVLRNMIALPRVSSTTTKAGSRPMLDLRDGGGYCTKGQCWGASLRAEFGRGVSGELPDFLNSAVLREDAASRPGRHREHRAEAMMLAGIPDS